MNRIVASLIALCALGLLYGAAIARAETPYDVAWSRQIGTTGTDQSSGVSVDAAGNTYISGSTQGSIGGPNAGSYDAFLIKYDGAGNHLWSRQIGTASVDYSFVVAVDATGNAYISGETSDSLGGPNAGSSDAFLVKYVVPEPSSFVLAALGILGLGAWARGQRRSARRDELSLWNTGKASGTQRDPRIYEALRLPAGGGRQKAV